MRDECAIDGHPVASAIVVGDEVQTIGFVNELHPLGRDDVAQSIAAGLANESEVALKNRFDGGFFFRKQIVIVLHPDRGVGPGEAFNEVGLAIDLHLPAAAGVEQFGLGS